MVRVYCQLALRSKINLYNAILFDSALPMGLAVGLRRK